MTHSPSCQRKEAGVLSALFIILSLAAYLFSLTVSHYTAILRMVTLCGGCGGVYVLVRYLYTRFTYYIVSPSGEDVTVLPREAIDFRVERRIGSRPSYAECMLSLDKLVSVRRFDGGTADELRREFTSPKLYYYTMALKPAEGKRTVLVFNDGGEVSCIVTELNEEMKVFLSSKVTDRDASL